MKKPKILFFLQVVGHPRDSKRIQMLQDEGFEVEAIAFERKYHKFTSHTSLEEAI